MCYFITMKDKFLGLVVWEVRFATAQFFFLLDVACWVILVNSKKAFLILVFSNCLQVFDILITRCTIYERFIEFFVHIALEIMIDSILMAKLGVARLAMQKMSLFSIFQLLAIFKPKTIGVMLVIAAAGFVKLVFGNF